MVSGRNEGFVVGGSCKKDDEDSTKIRSTTHSSFFM